MPRRKKKKLTERLSAWKEEQKTEKQPSQQDDKQAEVESVQEVESGVQEPAEMLMEVEETIPLKNALEWDSPGSRTIHEKLTMEGPDSNWSFPRRLLKMEGRLTLFALLIVFAVVAISDRPNFSSEYPRHVRDFPEFFECVKSHFLKITSRPKTGQNLARWIEVAWNSGKSRTCRGYSELKFGRSEMATTAPKGDDRSEKRRRPFGKATTVYETEICDGAGSGSTTNLALNRPATQSSTDFRGAPGRAVDGNRNAIYAKKSCSHTAMERDPWWRVDLGSSRCVDRVVVVKRQRIGGHWLEGFQVYVGDNPNVVENPTCGGKQSVAGKDVITVDCGGLTGRYVGIALPDKKQYLILCEVEVFGGTSPTEVSRPTLKYGQCAEGTTNLALNRPATQSSTDFRGAPGRAVDGNRNAIYAKKSCSHTAMERDPWWRVDLGSSQCVDRVVVVKRQHIGGHWLEGFQVYVGDNPNVVENPTCGGKQSVAGKDVITVDCGGLTGRYVGIALPDKKQYLILCEVEVFGGVTIKPQKAELIGSGLKLQAPKPKASAPPRAPQAPKPKVVQAAGQEKPAARHGVVITIGRGSSGGSSGSAGDGAINIINNQISVYSSGGGCHCKTARCVCPVKKGTDPSTASKPTDLTEILKQRLRGSVERIGDSTSNVQEQYTVETVSGPFVSEVSEERVVLQSETRETQGDLEDQLADNMAVSDDDTAVSDDDTAVSDDDMAVSDDDMAVSDDESAAQATEELEAVGSKLNTLRELLNLA
ncbi:hypothetical protein Bbelb_070620, partial [Branchiostoma belcheri]